jgi:hypothetical protein
MEEKLVAVPTKNSIRSGPARLPGKDSNSSCGVGGVSRQTGGREEAGRVDDRWLILPRYTQPERDEALLLHKLRLALPPQPPPRIRFGSADSAVEKLKM